MFLYLIFLFFSHLHSISVSSLILCCFCCYIFSFILPPTSITPAPLLPTITTIPSLLSRTCWLERSLAEFSRVAAHHIELLSYYDLTRHHHSLSRLALKSGLVSSSSSNSSSSIDEKQNKIWYKIPVQCIVRGWLWLSPLA